MTDPIGVCINAKLQTSLAAPPPARLAADRVSELCFAAEQKSSTAKQNSTLVFGTKWSYKCLIFRFAVEYSS